MKITIIVASTRPVAVGPKIGEWVADAVRTAGHEAKLVHLRELDLPFLDMEQLPSQANKQYPHESVMRWSKEIDQSEILLVVSPEYNHGIPGAFKNSIDWLWEEWAGKPTGIVTYSSGQIGGARCAIQLREVLGYVGTRLSRFDVAIPRVSDGVPAEAAEGVRKALENQLKDIAEFA